MMQMPSRQIQLLMMDDDVEQNDVSQNIIQGLQNKTVSNDVGMEKADEIKGSSVILGEQNIVHNGETFIQDQLTMVDFNNDKDQTSKLKEVEWNDDNDCGYGDNSEVENEFSDSSVKPSAKHIQKSNKKYKNVVVEDDDDRSKSCKSENSCFSQIFSTEPQGEPELQQFC
jgi:hypothetical protein